MPQPSLTTRHRVSPYQTLPTRVASQSHREIATSYYLAVIPPRRIVEFDSMSVTSFNSITPSDLNAIHFYGIKLALLSSNFREWIWTGNNRLHRRYFVKCYVKYGDGMHYAIVAEFQHFSQLKAFERMWACCELHMTRWSCNMIWSIVRGKNTGGTSEEWKEWKG